MFPQGFDDWFGDTYPKGESQQLNFETFENPSLDNNRDQILKEFFDSFNGRSTFWSSVLIQPGKLHWKQIVWTMREFRPEVPTPDKKCDIWNLQVGGILQEFTLTGAAVHHLNLNPSSSPSVFRFKNCLIGDLFIGGQSPSAEVELSECVVGTLRLEQRGRVKRLEINSGVVADIMCPTPSQENPFLGSVRFINVSLPSSRIHTKLFKGPQSYRNLLYHLEKLNNIVTANKIRALQMKAEREDDKGIMWLVNWVYGTFANYGTSPGLPLSWFLGLYAVVALAAYCGDASSLNQAFGVDVGQYKALSDSAEGRWYRAWLLPLQSITNPFGVSFDWRKVLIPVSIWWGIGLTLYGVVSDLLLLMFAFCIRRRFKVN